MELLIDRVGSPIGTILLVSDGQAIRALDFEDYEQRMHRLLRLHYGRYALTSQRNPAGLSDRIAAYFEGDIGVLDGTPVQTGGTPFQHKVWTALRQIPAGKTTTYGQLARQIGSPGASRAVGLANGSNPVAIVVPCHRVIGAGGALTGYGGGLDRKRWLLAHEGVSMSFDAATVRGSMSQPG